LRRHGTRCAVGRWQIKNSACHCLIHCRHQATLVVNNALALRQGIDSVLHLFSHTTIMPSHCVPQQTMHASPPAPPSPQADPSSFPPPLLQGPPSLSLPLPSAAAQPPAAASITLSVTVGDEGEASASDRIALGCKVLACTHSAHAQSYAPLHVLIRTLTLCRHETRHNHHRAHPEPAGASRRPSDDCLWGARASKPVQTMQIIFRAIYRGYRGSSSAW
jgi:hypothetical protein